MLFIGADHAGFELKQKLIQRFQKKIEIKDVGTSNAESCDYPIFAERVAREVLRHSGSLGLMICGTGQGSAMAANKVKGIRAACVSEPVSTRFAREHNNAQVLCLGARIVDVEQASECLEAFLKTPFSSEERHQKRVEQLKAIEEGEKI